MIRYAMAVIALVSLSRCAVAIDLEPAGIVWKPTGTYTASGMPASATVPFESSHILIAKNGTPNSTFYYRWAWSLQYKPQGGGSSTTVESNSTLSGSPIQGTFDSNGEFDLIVGSVNTTRTIYTGSYTAEANVIFIITSPTYMYKGNTGTENFSVSL